MTHLIPDEKDRNYTMRWCATLIACPGVKIKYALLMISEVQGVGKGTLMEKIMGPLVGWHNVSIPNEKQIVDSSFNSYLVRRRLVLVHEIYAGNTKKAYDKVKSGSEEHVDVEQKYEVPYRITNHAHFMLSSNSRLAMRVVKNDRRFLIPGITEAKKPPAYWLDLNAWLVDGGLEIIHQWAYDYVAQHGAIGPGDHAPLSAAKDQLIVASRSEGQQIAFDLGEEVMQFDSDRESGKGERNLTAKPIVLFDRDVRAWIAQKRGLDFDNPTLESLATVREQLRAAGMTEISEPKNTGVRYVAYGNGKALETLGCPDKKPTWNELKPHRTAPDDVVGF